jgi:hypothetical protein
VDAELAGLIGGGGHHRPLGRVALAAHDHRLAAQFGPASDLDRGKELVEVDMQHPPRPGPVRHAAQFDRRPVPGRDGQRLVVGAACFERWLRRDQRGGCRASLFGTAPDISES